MAHKAKFDRVDTKYSMEQQIDPWLLRSIDDVDKIGEYLDYAMRVIISHVLDTQLISLPVVPRYVFLLITRLLLFINKKLFGLNNYFESNLPDSRVLFKNRLCYYNCP